MTTIKPTSPTTLSVASWCVRGTMPQKRVSEWVALRDMDYFSSIFAEKSSISPKNTIAEGKKVVLGRPKM